MMRKIYRVEMWSVWGSLYITLLGCLLGSPTVLFFGVSVSIWSPLMIGLYKLFYERERIKVEYLRSKQSNPF